MFYKKLVWKFLRKLKTCLPYDPAMLVLGKYPKESKLAYHRDTCISMFIVALFIIA
jgi:hypothetical protein